MMNCSVIVKFGQYSLANIALGVIRNGLYTLLGFRTIRHPYSTLCCYNIAATFHRNIVNIDEILQNIVATLIKYRNNVTMSAFFCIIFEILLQHCWFRLIQYYRNISDDRFHNIEHTVKKNYNYGSLQKN